MTYSNELFITWLRLSDNKFSSKNVDFRDLPAHCVHRFPDDKACLTPHVTTWYKSGGIAGFKPSRGFPLRIFEGKGYS